MVNFSNFDLGYPSDLHTARTSAGLLLSSQRLRCSDIIRQSVSQISIMAITLINTKLQARLISHAFYGEITKILMLHFIFIRMFTGM